MAAMTPGAAFAISSGVQGLSTIGSTYAAASANRAESDYKKSQYAIQQQMAEIQAKDAEARGQRSVESLRRQTKKLIGSQRTALAAQGINIESGSALDVQLDTAQLSAMDELAIKSNAYREAFGYRSQALQAGNAAAFTGMAANFQERSTILTGGQRFISGGLSDYAAWRKR